MPVKHTLKDGEYRLAEWPCTSGHLRMKFNAEVSTHLLLVFGLSTIGIWSYFFITELLLPAPSHFNLWGFIPKTYKAMLLPFIKITSFYYHNLGLATFQVPNSTKATHAYRTSIFSSCQKSNLLHRLPSYTLYLNIFYQSGKGLNYTATMTC